MNSGATLGRLLGRGNVAEVFEYGSDVIKLYLNGKGRESAFREASTLAAIADSGLGVPNVRHVGEFDGRWGVVMSRAPEGERADWSASEIAAIHCEVHRIESGRLGSLKRKIAADISRASLLTDEDRTASMRRLEALPDGDRLCHGDFHPANVLGSREAPFIVDWVDASCGPPEADACRTYLLALHNFPEFTAPYLDAYAARSGVATPKILAWLPVLAAARLSENVPREEGRLLALARDVRPASASGRS